MKVGWILVTIYIVGAIAAATLPNCWKDTEPMVVQMEDVPLIAIAFPIVALVVWPIMTFSDCPEPKYGDDR